MNTTATATAAPVAEIWFQTTRTGQRRAYLYSFLANRTMPLPTADAELGLMTGRYVEINQSWLMALRTGTPVEFV